MAKVTRGAGEARRTGWGVGTVEEPYTPGKQVRGERMRNGGTRPGKTRCARCRSLLALQHQDGPALPRLSQPFSRPPGEWSTFTPDLPSGSLVRPQTPAQSRGDVSRDRSLNPNRGKSATGAASRPLVRRRVDAPAVTCAARGLRQSQARQEQHQELRRVARGSPSRPRPEPAHVVHPGPRAPGAANPPGAPRLPHWRLCP